MKQRYFDGQAIGAGTISVHIRRGDKVALGQMRHVTDETYQRYAQYLYAGSNNTLNQSMFLSTEDPAALSAMLSNMTTWKVQYTRIQRNNHNGKSVSDGKR
jgi:hypothetical protein